MKKKSELEIRDELEESVRGILGNRKSRSLEESLERALERTTPEEPGDPRPDHDKEGEEPSWI